MMACGKVFLLFGDFLRGICEEQPAEKLSHFTAFWEFYVAHVEDQPGEGDGILWRGFGRMVRSP